MILGRRLQAIDRRGKYLLLRFDSGHLLIHLGMSGSLRIIRGVAAPATRHEHVDICFGSGLTLRYTDPRRFGALLFTDSDPRQHPLLCDLGPEPLEEDFDASYLFRVSRHRRLPIKSLLMDSHVVVGVGNIYANEALFLAGIRPRRRAGSLSQAASVKLVGTVRTVLAQAIEMGGTTLRDFSGGDGNPGYFQQSLFVYGRGGMACRQCQSILKEVRVAQRSTVYCPNCQR
jgi:formamidopyrimidine-DNA glycosylase